MKDEFPSPNAPTFTDYTLDFTLGIAIGTDFTSTLVLIDGTTTTIEQDPYWIKSEKSSS